MGLEVVFQPRKVRRSGLWEPVEGRVVILVHKEHMPEDVKARYPSRHHVLIDHELGIPPADLVIERIGDLVNYDRPVFQGVARGEDAYGKYQGGGTWISE